MTDEQKAISRRAIACRGWTWGPGMLDLFGRRVRNVWPDDLGIHWSHIPENCVVRDADALPDLTDAATLGCLLALVREAWGQDDLAAFRFHGRWCVEVTPQEGPHHAFYGDTEAEALVAALECGEHRREEKP